MTLRLLLWLGCCEYCCCSFDIRGHVSDYGLCPDTCSGPRLSNQLGGPLTAIRPYLGLFWVLSLLQSTSYGRVSDVPHSFKLQHKNRTWWRWDSLDPLTGHQSTLKKRSYGILVLWLFTVKPYGLKSCGFWWGSFRCATTWMVYKNCKNWQR